MSSPKQGSLPHIPEVPYSCDWLITFYEGFFANPVPAVSPDLVALSFSFPSQRKRIYSLCHYFFCPAVYGVHFSSLVYVKAQVRPGENLRLKRTVQLPFAAVVFISPIE